MDNAENHHAEWKKPGKIMSTRCAISLIQNSRICKLTHLVIESHHWLPGGGGKQREITERHREMWKPRKYVLS